MRRNLKEESLLLMKQDQWKKDQKGILEREDHQEVAALGTGIEDQEADSK